MSSLSGVHRGVIIAQSAPFTPFLEIAVRFRTLISPMLVVALSLATLSLQAQTAQDNPCVKPAPRDGKWWTDRHNSMNERVKKGNVDLLMIGDSITHGWENGGAKKIWDEYYGKRNAVNLGIGGDRTEHVLWRLENGNIEGISPKLAVLMIGTNNRSAPEQVAEGIKAIVDKLRTKLPEMKILVLGIFPRGADDNDRLRQTNMKVNEIIAKLADNQKVFYLDIGDKFLAPDRTLPTDIMPDRLHPNEKGYKIWAEAVEPTIAKLMGEKQ